MKNKFFILALAGLSVFAACNKETDDTDNTGGNNNGGNNNNNNPPPALTINSSKAFYGTLDGVSKSYTSNFGYGTDGQYFLTSGVLLDEQEGVYLEIGKIYPYTDVLDFINEGSVSFSQNGSNGIVVVWKAANDEIGWRSDVGGQSGSSFTFDALQKTDDVVDRVKYKATFNCKVYKNGASKTIEGQMVWYFQDLI